MINCQIIKFTYFCVPKPQFPLRLSCSCWLAFDIHLRNKIYFSWHKRAKKTSFLLLNINCELLSPLLSMYECVLCFCDANKQVRQTNNLMCRLPTIYTLSIHNRETNNKSDKMCVLLPLTYHVMLFGACVSNHRMMNDFINLFEWNFLLLFFYFSFCAHIREIMMTNKITILCIVVL
jgi:hypothetical protein